MEEVIYPLPLRDSPRYIGKLIVPDDLTVPEAEKICRIVMALAVVTPLDRAPLLPR